MCHINRRSRIPLGLWVEVLDVVHLPLLVSLKNRPSVPNDRNVSDSLAFRKYEWLARP